MKITTITETGGPRIQRHVTVNFDAKHQQFQPHGLVCQGKKLNTVITFLKVSFAELKNGVSRKYSVNSKVQTFSTKKQLMKVNKEVFSQLYNFWDSLLIVKSTSKCQLAFICVLKRKECHHVHSAFSFDKQGHVIEIIGILHQNQLSHVCFVYLLL